jgi:phosphoglycerate dehydrogenase-like enzyme
VRRPLVVIVTMPGETSPPGIDAIRARTDVRLAATEKELTEALPGAEILLVLDFNSQIVRNAWWAAEDVRWVHAASAGVDVIAFPELAHADDVTVTNARGVFDRPIAEWVAGVMLLFVKDLRTTLDLQRQATWRHRETHMLAGTRATVVGAGGIGRAIARLASSLGCEVEGVARSARDEDPDFGRIHAADDLHAVLPDSDWVVLAVPLTAATRGMIGADELSRMKPTARLINVARGEVVDEPPHVDAQPDRTLGGAALEVFPE